MNSLAQVFGGWDGYQRSLLRAVTPLTAEQLAWRPAPHVRALGEVVRHLALGRITWLAGMNPPGIEEAVAAVPQWFTDGDGTRHVVEQAVACNDSSVLVDWLVRSWLPIKSALATWTLDDLTVTYPHRFRGTDYLLSRQWILWRVLSHDTHHGGQIAMMLAMQGIEAFELRALGGHITVPPLAIPRSEEAG